MTFSKWLVLALAILMVLAACTPKEKVVLTNTDPEKVGLVWKECKTGAPGEMKQIEACFGRGWPMMTEAERARLAMMDDTHQWQLKIGSDTYRVRSQAGLLPLETFTLSENDKVISRMQGEFTTFSPSVSLRAIAGKAAWEFSDIKRATIIYGDEDVVKRYALDKAYAPYELNGKLLFIGQKGSSYFVVYDQHKVGLEFDEVSISYCCEPSAWSARGGDGRYAFWGRRGSQWYLVEVSAN